MTRPESDVTRVAELARSGLNGCEIARRTGVPLSTVSRWARGDLPGRTRTRPVSCLRCSGYSIHPLPALTDFAYAYLLGLYLGDGCLLKAARGVFRLNITLDSRYPCLIAEAAAAIRLVMPVNAVSVAPHLRHNYVGVNCYSKHWPCLFPQHGPGKKHERRIVLASWQREIVDRHPWRFLRGLVQSDGCRSINRIEHPGKTYSYPRYSFSNHSDDIRALFCEYCDRVGVEWRRMNRWNISVARRDSVALMDRHIGPKR